jgi:polysaccharide deacetylase 2 family uncharacterized protein YibQ
MTLLDILNEKKYRTDKHTDHHYIQQFYDEAFLSFRESNLNFLEIGVWNGESMKLWADYFINAKNIVGVDVFIRTPMQKVKENLSKHKTTLHQLNSVNCSIEEFNNFSKLYPEGFDIIIDDGSHVFNDQITTYNKFKLLMKKGGIYIIEDMGNESESTREAFKKLIPEINIFLSHGGRHNSLFGVIYF